MATTNLWIIWSAENGYRTANGWALSSKLANLFTREAADAFIASADPSAFLLGIHYDARVAHTDDLLNVEVVCHKIAAVPESKHLGELARRAIHDLKRCAEPTEYVRRFDHALARYDDAFDALRRRLHPYKVLGAR